MAAMLACAVLAPQPALANSSVTRQIGRYDPPRVMLTDSSGRSVPLTSLLNEQRPVILEFFYTTCTTICGLQNSALANARAALGNNATLISITIDPEFDTSAKLRAYAKMYHTGANWHLLTGSRGDIQAILTAFDARPFGDNKMLHKPYVFIHVAPDRQWLRLEGLLDGKGLVAEYRKALTSPPPLAQSETAMGALRRWWASR